MMRKILVTGVVAVIAMLAGCSYFGPCLDGSGPIISELREIEDFTGVSNTGSFDVYIATADSFGVEVIAQENLMPIIETYVSGYTLVVKTRNGECFRSGIPVKVMVTMPETELIRLTGSGRVFAERAESADVEISNSGSGYMEIDSVLSDTYILSNSGSGHISVTGTYTNELDAIQSGSGAILCGTLLGATEVSIRHSSSGSISARIIDGTVIDVVLSGSGTVELEGDLETADYSLNSSGRIDALDLMASDVEATNTGSGKLYVWAIDLLDATITGSGDIIYRGNPVITTRITGTGNVRSY
jgi:hypothetical protein